MQPITLAALEASPRELEKHYAAFPPEFVHRAPSSWLCSHDQQTFSELQRLLGKIDAARTRA